MQEFIERMSPKLKKIAKKSLLAFAALVVFFTIVIDLDKPGGGYIRPVFYWVLSTIIAGYTNAIEIAHTPLAALTIAKIAELIFYAGVGIVLFGIGRAILSFVFWVLEELRGSRESE